MCTVHFMYTYDVCNNSCSVDSKWSYESFPKISVIYIDTLPVEENA